MRFKSQIKNIQRFTKLAASLSSLGKIAWFRLDNDQVRFTVIPEQGSQVWAVLSIDSIFDNYTIQSASSGNAINLEVPIQPLHSALKSALNASSASIRLTKKDNIPLLSLTIVTNSYTSGISTTTDDGLGGSFGDDASFAPHGRDRETIITQDVAVRVLSAESVEGIHEPRCREPDVHIMLPSLMQIKSISERYTKIAATTATNPSAGSGSSPKLELSGNMYGSLKISITTDALSISSVWTGLVNPELDAAQIEGGLSNHPSTRMKILGANGGDQGWAKVRIDGKDWLRVLAVGRLGGKFIACIVDDLALILYVYLPNDDDGSEDSVLTYYISSYTA